MPREAHAGPMQAPAPRSAPTPGERRAVVGYLNDVAGLIERHAAVLAASNRAFDAFASGALGAEGLAAALARCAEDARAVEEDARDLAHPAPVCDAHADFVRAFTATRAAFRALAREPGLASARSAESGASLGEGVRKVQALAARYT